MSAADVARDANIPDIIEEKRKDAVEGKVTQTKYVRGKLLGKGGFAKCFLAVMLPSKTQYAIKIVSKSTLAKSRAKQKLQTEIRIHRVLRHSNVVHFERYFEDVNNAYMLLELCHNNSMSELMKRRKKLLEPEVRFYLVQLVNGLKFLHGNLVVHRDLKLGNLFLDHEMRVKIGDFGLAAKLTAVDERRRTVCGTPNYIAPEILEAKEGHSFPVDVWSTGVIMYTLMVGKPPFESKDVKSTYKRILANSFTFPEHTTVCDHSKHLIRSILQHRPENRPKLEDVLEHSFFTRSAAYTPQSLPDSAMREPPLFPSMPRVASDRRGSEKATDAPIQRTLSYGDENDAGVINKPSLVSKGDGATGALKTGGNAGSSDRDRRPFADITSAQSNRPSTRSATSSRLSSFATKDSAKDALAKEVKEQKDACDPSTRMAQPTQPAVGLNRRTLSSSRATAPLRGSGSTTSAGARASSVATAAQSTAHAETRSRASGTNKFSIYDDKLSEPFATFTDRPLDRPATLHANSAKHDSIESAKNASRGSSKHDSVDSAGCRKMSVDEKSKDGNQRFSAEHRMKRPSSAIELMQHGMERVVITEEKDRLRAPKLWEKNHSPPDTESDPAKVEGVKSQEAWAWKDNHGEAELRSSKPEQASFNAIAQLTRSRATTGTTTDGTECDVDEPSQDALSPPPEDQMKKDQRPPGTLETMHDVLAKTCGGLDDDYYGSNGALLSDIDRKSKAKVPRRSAAQDSADVWVVRYVDYTSKYGLGFLLNTGSAGVYFNDSTKIVLSPDGKVFQYIERKKKVDGVQLIGADHTIQTHLLTRYPAELNKKVTLLCHFRNYLVDQHKSNMHEEQPVAQLDNFTISSKNAQSGGSSSHLKFGQSSVRYIGPSPGATEETSSCYVPIENMEQSNENEMELPFLKKWVRTRHAILFRLSNRTVQVVFFDRSEILLSSEARIVTYVSKAGDRSEHSLEEVLQHGRKDISKRLKYTKDIMYRLINIQTR